MMKSSERKILFLVSIFFIFQVLSFLGYRWPNSAGIFFLLIVLGTIGLTFYKFEYGFLILIFEFFFGHDGRMLEFYGISLRFTLFVVLMLIWLVRRAGRFKSFFINQPLTLLLLLFGLFILLARGRGVIRNNPTLAIKDFINYSYFLLIFPLVDIFSKKDFYYKVFSIGQSAIIGIGLLTIFIFILFATGAAQVHDSFYWWWRNVAAGKATYAGNNFFRIVTPAHLLILPLFLFYLSFLAESKISQKIQKTIVWSAIFASLTLLINFSRAYFLGILAGLIILAKGLKFRRWLIFSVTVIVLMVCEFVLIYGLASGNFSLGLDIFKNRLETVVGPEQELSSFTRLVILPKILEQIKGNLFFGRGLGSTVSYLNPLNNQMETTLHLDWGYLEICLELGLLGLLIYLSILALIFYQGWRLIARFNILESRATTGLLAGLGSLMVATLTGPFLFHSLGIFYISIIIALLINQNKNDNI